MQWHPPGEIAPAPRCSSCLVLSLSVERSLSALDVSSPSRKGKIHSEDAESTPPLLPTERPDVYSSVFTLLPIRVTRARCSSARGEFLTRFSFRRPPRQIFNYLGRSVGVMRSGVQISRPLVGKKHAAPAFVYISGTHTGENTIADDRVIPSGARRVQSLVRHVL